jgi:hypothetical protein
MPSERSPGTFSRYRAIVAPTIAYVEWLRAQRADLTVIVPEVAARHWWQRTLHGDAGAQLRRALRPLERAVVTSVPFHM